MPSVLLLSMCLLAGHGGAQDRGGGIVGTVRDASGGAIAGASLTVTSETTGARRHATTAMDGTYQIWQLQPGDYLVEARRDGFKTSRRPGIRVEIDRLTVARHVLSVGAASDEITVVGDASTIEAGPASLSSVVTSRTIEQLPLNGRDYIRLAVLDAGATIARSQSRNVNNGWGLQISLAGGRPYQNNYRLDGLESERLSQLHPGQCEWHQPGG